MTVTVIGKNSFLGQGLQQNPACADWVFLSHADISQNIERIRNSDIVINFAFSPTLVSKAYEESEDIDSSLAGIIQNSNARYIMMSSRMVYGPVKGDDIVFKESDTLQPHTSYGSNKKIIEEKLQTLLGPDHLCILRLANIFGDEAGRKTFFGVALKNLRDHGRMVFDIAPESVRDFLPATVFQDWLIHIARNFQGGIYNIGSGFATSCDDVTRWLIEGYGQGAVDFTGDARNGEFGLSMEKTRAAFGLPGFTETDLADACRRCGENLKSL